MLDVRDLPSCLQGEVRDGLMQKVIEKAEGDSSVQDYANGDKWFAVWLKVLDIRVLQTWGVGLFDLRDFTLRDWFDDGITPKQALRLIREEGPL